MNSRKSENFHVCGIPQDCQAARKARRNARLGNFALLCPVLGFLGYLALTETLPGSENFALIFLGISLGMIPVLFGLRTSPEICPCR